MCYSIIVLLFQVNLGDNVQYYLNEFHSNYMPVFDYRKFDSKIYWNNTIQGKVKRIKDLYYELGSKM